MGVSIKIYTIPLMMRIPLSGCCRHDDNQYWALILIWKW